ASAGVGRFGDSIGVLREHAAPIAADGDEVHAVFPDLRQINLPLLELLIDERRKINLAGKEVDPGQQMLDWPAGVASEELREIAAQLAACRLQPPPIEICQYAAHLGAQFRFYLFTHELPRSGRPIALSGGLDDSAPHLRLY